MRNHYQCAASDAGDIKSSLLSWLQQFEQFAYYDSCNQPLALNASNYDWIAAAGAESVLSVDSNCLTSLEEFRTKNQDWLFGGYCYELKDEIEVLSSSHPLHVHFPRLFFFQPKHIIYQKDGIIYLESMHAAKQILEEIKNTLATASNHQHFESCLESLVSKDKYIQNVEKIREHIRVGDIYEMNYCVAFTAENVSPDPLQLYRSLVQCSPAPFSALFRWKDKYLVSASPERFLMKKDRRLLSQPIKGTARRSKDAEEDKNNAGALQQSEKERAENVMIVDLVRNDLSRSSKAGTVKVDELFGIYSFPAVHQMISSVSSEMREGVSVVEAIKNAFPMGSMTGAPKVMTMKLVEQYENSARGIYSGSVGYFTANGDFDFNVVIRSIMLDRGKEKLSFHVGSAITYDSVAEQEYEECMLKAKALKTVLEQFGICER